MYDPGLGRWHSVDPLSEKYYSWAPYNYVVNNPIIYIDPDGMRIANSKSKDAKRFKKIMKSTKVGRKIYRKMRRARRKIFIHYVDKDSDEKMTQYLNNSFASGEMMSSSRYNEIQDMTMAEIKSDFNSNIEHTDDYTFNKKTGEWDMNQNEDAHVLINDELIEILAIFDEDQAKDQEIESVVHEGYHSVDSYDWTESKENPDGTYTNSGNKKDYNQRNAEKRAREKANSALEEYKNED